MFNYKRLKDGRCTYRITGSSHDLNCSKLHVNRAKILNGTCVNEMSGTASRKFRPVPCECSLNCLFCAYIPKTLNFKSVKSIPVTYHTDQNSQVWSTVLLVHNAIEHHCKEYFQSMMTLCESANQSGFSTLLARFARKDMSYLVVSPSTLLSQNLRLWPVIHQKLFDQILEFIRKYFIFTKKRRKL